MKWFARALLVIAAGALAASCGSRACTLVGCSPSVDLSVSGLADQPYGAKVCLEQRCCAMQIDVSHTMNCLTGSTEPRPAWITQASFANGTLKLHVLEIDQTAAGPYAVSVQLTDASERVVASHDQAVTFDTYRPNGPECDPICYSGSVSFSQ